MKIRPLPEPDKRSAMISRKNDGKTLSENYDKFWLTVDLKQSIIHCPDEESVILRLWSIATFSFFTWSIFL